MKTKLKAPEVAQAKGADYVKKMVKKRLTEPFEEGAVQFLYDADFDYGSAAMGGKSPLLFVGELSSEWRKYLKENKNKASIAAGRCLPAKEDPTFLNMEVKLGKGGKQKFLKVINKDLLKPFAEARFVDSVESGKVLDGDIQEMVEDKSPEVASMEADATSNELLEEGKELLAMLSSGKTELDIAVTKLEPMSKDMSKTVMTAAVVKDIEVASAAVDENDIDVLVSSADSWLKGDAKKEMANNKEMSEVYGKLVTAVSALKPIKPKIIAIQAFMSLLRKLSPPSSGASSAPAPISKNPLSNFRANMANSSKKFDDLASVGDHLKVT